MLLNKILEYLAASPSFREAFDAPEKGVALLVEGANDTYMPGICGGLITTMFYDHAGAFPELYRYTSPGRG